MSLNDIGLIGGFSLFPFLACIDQPYKEGTTMTTMEYHPIIYCSHLINEPVAWVICTLIVTVAVLTMTWRLWLKGDGR